MFNLAVDVGKLQLVVAILNDPLLSFAEIDLEDCLNRACNKGLRIDN